MVKGLEVHFTSPIRKSVMTETENVSIAVNMAIDWVSARHPNKDWKQANYEVYTCNLENNCRTCVEPIYKK